jgi:hypothetical protein
MHALGAESYQLSSPSVRRDHAGRSRSYASGSHEHNGLYSLANRKARDPIHIRTQGQSVVDYSWVQRAS